MKKNKNSSRLLYYIRQWHWISAAFSLAGLFLFASTGFLLNNDNLFSAKPTVVGWEKVLPDELPILSEQNKAQKQLPPSWQNWLSKETGYHIAGQKQEWEEGEIYIRLPSPGSDAWISILTEEKLVTFEQSKRGIVALLKDLHKGRNTGKIWSWVIDIFAIFCVVFSITGLLLLVYYQRQRKSTWVIVSTGFIFPLVLVLLFMHI